MHIAVFPSLIAPVSADTCYGGAEMAALALAESLAARGHRVALVGLPGSGGRGLEVIAAPHTPAFHPGDIVSADPGPFPEIFARLREFDLVHTHFNDPGGLLALDAARIPAIATLHLSAVFPSTAAVVRSTRNIAYVAPSAYAARSYERPCRVIPNGVSGIELGRGARSGLAWAGRRTPEKGLDAAIEIARRAQLPLFVAGPGDAVSGPGIVDRGRLLRADVGQLLGRVVATLVTSSIAEAHPLVAIESLFAGTPVVGFDVGGLAEIISPSTWVLVPPGDIAAAVSALKKTFAPADCRARAEASFRHDTMVEAYEGLYRSAVLSG